MTRIVDVGDLDRPAIPLLLRNQALTTCCYRYRVKDPPFILCDLIFVKIHGKSRRIPANGSAGGVQ
jgi:hypothetical protein